MSDYDDSRGNFRRAIEDVLRDKRVSSEPFSARAHLSQFWGGFAGEPVFGIGSGRSLRIANEAEKVLPAPATEDDEPESPDCSA